MNINAHQHANNNWLDDVKIHPLRATLTNEIHARPFISLESNLDVLLFAKITGENASESEFQNLTAFCEKHSLSIPSLGTRHLIIELNGFRLRWERHGEFTTYTVILPTASKTPFTEKTPHIIQEWLSNSSGELLVATHLSVRTEEKDLANNEITSQFFDNSSTVSAKIANNEAQVWTDLQIHPSGFNRILMYNSELRTIKLGRMVQRLIDVSIYRNMALLALPDAQKAAKKIAYLDSQLSESLHKLRESTKVNASKERKSYVINNESEMLQELTDLSMQLQRLAAQTQFRLSASKAYYALVKSRIDELKEEDVDGYQTIGEFLQRRLTPAMRTCESVTFRLEDLSNRTSRAVMLLRTRLDQILEKQNHEVLESMNKRAKVQMRLQETVEGLSIAAITYYFVGLIGYLAKSTKGLNLPVSPEFIMGVSVIPVGWFVWYGIRRTKRKILAKSDIAHRKPE
ncbi:MAG: DUF3422 domain-containing protein [Glaciecola sp.]